MNDAVLSGGDRKLLEREGLLGLFKSWREFPCHICGRPVLIGDGCNMELAARGVPVACMWCVFKDDPEVLSKIGPRT